MTADHICAVAVRDGEELFLLLRIRRNRKGVFVLIWREDKGWDPHASYHADGQTHQKSFDRKSNVRQRQKPDVHFCGTENLLTMGVAADEPRAINDPCKPDQFSEVFEIPVAELSPEKYRSYIAVDLVEPGEPAISGARILRHTVFKDTVPHILVTFFLNPP